MPDFGARVGRDPREPKSLAVHGSSRKVLTWTSAKVVFFVEGVSPEPNDGRMSLQHSHSVAKTAIYCKIPYKTCEKLLKPW